MRREECQAVSHDFRSEFSSGCSVTKHAIATITISVVTCFFGSVACKREQRNFQQAPASHKSYEVTMSDLRPGSTQPEPTINNESEAKAYDVSEGKRLYTQYNCAGCHFNGGGGIGPALMDAQWIYGEKPASVYDTILEGRPNGIPSFRHKI